LGLGTLPGNMTICYIRCTNTPESNFYIQFTNTPENMNIFYIRFTNTIENTIFIFGAQTLANKKTEVLKPHETNKFAACLPPSLQRLIC
jgi:hypothetical protein